MTTQNEYNKALALRDAMLHSQRTNKDAWGKYKNQQWAKDAVSAPNKMRSDGFVPRSSVTVRNTANLNVKGMLTNEVFKTVYNKDPKISQHEKVLAMKNSDWFKAKFFNTPPSTTSSSNMVNGLTPEEYKQKLVQQKDDRVSSPNFTERKTKPVVDYGWKTPMNSEQLQSNLKKPKNTTGMFGNMNDYASLPNFKANYDKFTSNKSVYNQKQLEKYAEQYRKIYGG